MERGVGVGVAAAGRRQRDGAEDTATLPRDEDHGLGRAVGHRFGGDRRAVVVGRDTRGSGPALMRQLVAGFAEAGVRALLNLGHTFAHALEASAGYDGALLHGEAVGAGMALAFKLSARLELCPAQEAAGEDVDGPSAVRRAGPVVHPTSSRRTRDSARRRRFCGPRYDSAPRNVC